MPKLPPKLLDCSFYLYPNVADARDGKGFGGTGFIVGVPSEIFPDEIVHLYAVTNWHVACRDGCSVIRVNTVDGDCDIFDAGPEEWTFIAAHDDIAVIELPLKRDQHRFTYIDTASFVTMSDIHSETGRIGVGDDVFMVGRFIDHDGRARNSPSVRFGNISMLPEGDIQRPNGVKIPSFCVDMHSRTGYSGSPVFVYRVIGTNLTVGNIDMRDRFLLLLGIHWGQFPEFWEIKSHRDLAEAAAKEGLIVEGKYVQGLSGMTCVAPAWAIKEVLNLEKFKIRRAASSAAFKERERVRLTTSEPTSQTGAAASSIPGES